MWHSGDEKENKMKETAVPINDVSLPDFNLYSFNKYTYLIRVSSNTIKMQNN